MDRFGSVLAERGEERWRRRYRRLTARLDRVDLTAGRIALFYLALGLLALYLSDVVLVWYLSDPLLGRVQAAKGGVEVLLTGGLIFVLARRSRRQLRRTNDRLERRNEELRLLHRVYRHNLRNELTVLRLSAERLNGTGEPACERLLEATDRLQEHVEQIRRIRKVSRSADRRRLLDLSRAVRRVVEDHPLVTDAVEVTTAVPDAAPVRVHPMFPEAIAELVSNAIEHDDGSPAVTIAVDPGAGPPGTTELLVVDDGPGMPELELAALRSDTSTPLSHHAGMGLWFVAWVVSHSDGDFAIPNSGPEGTKVRVCVPTAASPPEADDPECVAAEG